MVFQIHGSVHTSVFVLLFFLRAFEIRMSYTIILYMIIKIWGIYMQVTSIYNITLSPKWWQSGSLPPLLLYTLTCDLEYIYKNGPTLSIHLISEITQLCVSITLDECYATVGESGTQQDPQVSSDFMEEFLKKGLEQCSGDRSANCPVTFEPQNEPSNV